MCQEKVIEGIEFKFCANKNRVKKDENLELSFFAKIPANKEIYVEYRKIWYRFSDEKNQMIFYLGSCEIPGLETPPPQFFDLKKLSKKNIYEYNINLKISDLEKKYKTIINGNVKLYFSVSFLIKLGPLEGILLPQNKRPYIGWEKKYNFFCLNYIPCDNIGCISIEVLKD